MIACGLHEVMHAADYGAVLYRDARMPWSARLMPYSLRSFVLMYE
jgi:hypothetical protein